MIGGTVLRLEIVRLAYKATAEMGKTRGEVIFGGSVVCCTQAAWIRVRVLPRILIQLDTSGWISAGYQSQRVHGNTFADPSTTGSTGATDSTVRVEPLSPNSLLVPLDILTVLQLQIDACLGWVHAKFLLTTVSLIL